MAINTLIFMIVQCCIIPGIAVQANLCNIEYISLRIVEFFKHIRYEEDSMFRNAEVSQLHGCLRHCRQAWRWRDPLFSYLALCSLSP